MNIRHDCVFENAGNGFLFESRFFLTINTGGQDDNPNASRFKRQPDPGFKI